MIDDKEYIIVDVIRSDIEGYVAHESFVNSEEDVYYPLSDASYTLNHLTNPENEIDELIYELETDEDGYFIIKDIKYGDYELTEVDLPDGMLFGTWDEPNNISNNLNTKLVFNFFADTDKETIALNDTMSQETRAAYDFVEAQKVVGGNQAYQYVQNDVMRGDLYSNIIGESFIYYDDGLYPLDNINFEIHPLIDGDEIINHTSNDEGNTSELLLKYGEYDYCQVSWHEGYINDIDNSCQYFNIVDHMNDYYLDFINLVIRGDLVINKLDQDIEPLAGAKFNITHETLGPEPTIEPEASYTYDFTDTYTSDNNGKIIIENIKYGNYLLVESEAPEGYILDQDNVYMDYLSTEGQILEYTIFNRIFQGVLRIEKVYEHDNCFGKDKCSNYYLEFPGMDGVDFEIYSSAEDNVSNEEVKVIVTTNAKGIAHSPFLPIGTYTITELYDEDSVYDVYDPSLFVGTIELTEDEQYLQITEKPIINQLKGGYIDGCKYGYEGYNKLLAWFNSERNKQSDEPLVCNQMEGFHNQEGVEFQLYKINMFDEYEYYETIYSDENGYFASSNLPKGYYRVYETMPLAGFEPIDYVEVYVSGNHDYYHVNKHGNIINTQDNGSIIVQKQEHYTSVDGRDILDPLGGVTFLVFDSEGIQVDSFETDINGIGISKNLEAGIYTVKEVTPEGYVLNETIYEIEITGGGAQFLTNEPIVNERIQGRLDLCKLEGTTGDEVISVAENNEGFLECENGIEGVKFDLWYADEDFNINPTKLKDVITTDENGYGISRVLDYGNYVLKERKAAEGYVLSDIEYPVSVTKHGVLIHANNSNAIINVQQGGLVKYDKYGVLPNVGFTIEKDGIYVQNENPDLDLVETCNNKINSSIVHFTNENGILDILSYGDGDYVIKEVCYDDSTYNELDQDIEFELIEGAIHYNGEIVSEIPVYNEKLVDTSIDKVINDGSLPIGQFGFVVIDENGDYIKPKSDMATPLDYCQNTGIDSSNLYLLNDNQSVLIEDLTPGRYVLKEVCFDDSMYDDNTVEIEFVVEGEKIYVENRVVNKLTYTNDINPIYTIKKDVYTLDGILDGDFDYANNHFGFIIEDSSGKLLINDNNTGGTCSGYSAENIYYTDDLGYINIPNLAERETYTIKEVCYNEDVFIDETNSMSFRVVNREIISDNYINTYIEKADLNINKQIMDSDDNLIYNDDVFYISIEDSKGDMVVNQTPLELVCDEIDNQYLFAVDTNNPLTINNLIKYETYTIKEHCYDTDNYTPLFDEVSIKLLIDNNEVIFTNILNKHNVIIEKQILNSKHEKVDIDFTNDNFGFVIKSDDDYLKNPNSDLSIGSCSELYDSEYIFYTDKNGLLNLELDLLKEYEVIEVCHGSKYVDVTESLIVNDSSENYIYQNMLTTHDLVIEKVVSNVYEFDFSNDSFGFVIKDESDNYILSDNTSEVCDGFSSNQVHFTDENGLVKIMNLDSSRYTLTEVCLDDNKYTDQTKEIVIELTNDMTYQYVNSINEEETTINKRVVDSNDNLMDIDYSNESFGFVIEGPNGILNTSTNTEVCSDKYDANEVYFTDLNGSIYLDLLVDVNYQVREVCMSDNYTDITNNLTVNSNNENIYTNQLNDASLIIEKEVVDEKGNVIDIDYSNEQFNFIVIDGAGEQLASNGVCQSYDNVFTTDAKGMIEISSLYAGDRYTIMEVCSNSKYVDITGTVEVNLNTGSNYITYTNMLSDELIIQKRVVNEEVDFTKDVFGFTIQEDNARGEYLESNQEILIPGYCSNVSSNNLFLTNDLGQIELSLVDSESKYYIKEVCHPSNYRDVTGEIIFETIEQIVYYDNIVQPEVELIIDKEVKNIKGDSYDVDDIFYFSIYNDDTNEYLESGNYTQTCDELDSNYLFEININDPIILEIVQGNYIIREHCVDEDKYTNTHPDGLEINLSKDTRLEYINIINNVTTSVGKHIVDKDRNDVNVDYTKEKFTFIVYQENNKNELLVENPNPTEGVCDGQTVYKSYDPRYLWTTDDLGNINVDLVPGEEYKIREVCHDAEYKRLGEDAYRADTIVIVDIVAGEDIVYYNEILDAKLTLEKEVIDLNGNSVDYDDAFGFVLTEYDGTIIKNEDYDETIKSCNVRYRDDEIFYLTKNGLTIDYINEGQVYNVIEVCSDDKYSDMTFEKDILLTNGNNKVTYTNLLKESYVDIISNIDTYQGYNLYDQIGNVVSGSDMVDNCRLVNIHDQKIDINNLNDNQTYYISPSCYNEKYQEPQSFVYSNQNNVNYEFDVDNDTCSVDNCIIENGTAYFYDNGFYINEDISNVDSEELSHIKVVDNYGGDIDEVGFVIYDGDEVIESNNTSSKGICYFDSTEIHYPQNGNIYLDVDNLDNIRLVPDCYDRSKYDVDYEILLDDTHQVEVNLRHNHDYNVQVVGSLFNLYDTFGFKIVDLDNDAYLIPNEQGGVIHYTQSDGSLNLNMLESDHYYSLELVSYDNKYIDNTRDLVFKTDKNNISLEYELTRSFIQKLSASTSDSNTYIKFVDKDGHTISGDLTVIIKESSDTSLLQHDEYATGCAATKNINPTNLVNVDNGYVSLSSLSPGNYQVLALCNDSDTLKVNADNILHIDTSKQTGVIEYVLDYSLPEIIIRSEFEDIYNIGIAIRSDDGHYINNPTPVSYNDTCLSRPRDNSPISNSDYLFYPDSLGSIDISFLEDGSYSTYIVCSDYEDSGYHYPVLFEKENDALVVDNHIVDFIDVNVEETEEYKIGICAKIKTKLFNDTQECSEKLINAATHLSYAVYYEGFHYVGDITINSGGVSELIVNKPGKYTLELVSSLSSHNVSHDKLYVTVDKEGVIHYANDNKSILVKHSKLKFLKDFIIPDNSELKVFYDTNKNGKVDSLDHEVTVYGFDKYQYDLDDNYIVQEY